MYKLPLLLLLFFGMLGRPLFAQSRSGIDKSTDVLMFVPAATGLVLTLCHKDKTGFGQLALSGATTLAANYLLELSIKKRRPDGSGNHAFPSTHAAVTFAGATFVQQRYGWKWGLPAYLVSTYVAWGRIYAKKHDAWDVLAGVAIGAGSSFLFTRPFAKDKALTLAPLATQDGAGLYLGLRF